MSIPEVPDRGGSHQRPIFTEEERSLGEMLIYDAFVHQHLLIDSKTIEFGEGLKRADAAGYTLSNTSKLLTQALLEVIKKEALIP